MDTRPAQQLVYRMKTSRHTVYDIQYEVDMLKSNRHVNIISLVSMDGENMIMPAFPGGSLDRFILSRDRFTESEVFFVFYQIISGLQYLHNKGIVHRAGRTLKSRVVIADFGLAFYNKEEGKRHLNHGTFSYFAPEIVKETGDLAHFTTKSDCWAAGVVLLTMIDKHPFEDYDKSEESLREDILNSRLEPHISKNHPDFKSLLSGLLQMDASQRFSASECLQSSWMIERANPEFFAEYEVMVLQHFTEERRIWFGEKAKDEGHYCLYHLPAPTEEPAYRVRKTHIRPKVKKSSYRVNIQIMSSTKSVVEDWIEAVNEERFTRSDHRSRQ
ncbi:kinase-like domain-containing protein [Sporodiniella umbellata]|nr:kinase-like domain-containing protein [Sporodiniella umbellata]